MVPGSSKGLSTGGVGLTTPNVNDGVGCLFSGNCVPRESGASPNVDINVFTKTLILEIEHIFYFFQQPTTFLFFFHKKFKGFNKVLQT